MGTYRATKAAVSVGLATICLHASSSFAALLTVYGGPTYDSTTQTGYRGAVLQHDPGASAGAGVGVAYSTKYVAGANRGPRGFRWDTSGAAPTELGILGASNTGFSTSTPYAVNNQGVAVGVASRYVNNASAGVRAVRWDALGSITELGNLGTNNDAVMFAQASAVNNAGTAVGFAEKNIGGTSKGSRAVRWNASGTAATELGNLGAQSNGITNSKAYAINSAGVAVGYALRQDNLRNYGERAVRWDASGTAAIELGVIGDGGGATMNSQAVAVNDDGVIAGWSEKFENGGNGYRGRRAVRWDALGTAATELDNLGTNSSGVAETYANAINSTGTIVGRAYKYSGSTTLGYRAVRWGAAGTAATELGNLGVDGTGLTASDATAINASGIAVGWAFQYSNGQLVGGRAVLWNLDAIALDLNTLIDPSSGWTLTEAIGISDTQLISGRGMYDPDGDGPLDAYQRAFLLDVSSVVPEPAGAISLWAALITLLRRRRG